MVDRDRALRALAEAADGLAGARDQDALARRAVQVLVADFGARASQLWLREPGGGARLLASAGSVLATVPSNGRPGPAVDATAWVDDVVGRGTPVVESPGSPVASAVGFQVSLPVAAGAVLGVLHYVSDEPLDAPAVDLLRTFAALVASALRAVQVERPPMPALGADRGDLILNSTAQGIYGVDLQGRSVFVNRAAASLTGYSVEELLGQDLHRLIHSARPDGSPYPWSECPTAATLLNGASQRVIGEHYWRKDGTSFPVEYASTPIMENGRIVGAVIAFSDITERLRAEAEQARLLRQSEAAEARFRALVESAPDAILITDRAGRIDLVNHRTEELFGYARQELLGQPVEVLMPERFRSAHAVHRAGYSQAPRRRPMGRGMDLVGRRKDGSEFPVEISLSPLELDAGWLVISVVRDITAQRSFERQKDEFFANISHDLRTPVTAIKASIGVVLANEPPGTPEPLHRMFVNIDKAVDRMANLVADLLELTRLQAGRVQLQLGRHDLRGLARRSADAVEPLAQARGQRLEVDLPADPVAAWVDAERLERALLNLLTNAHKYGRTNGVIRVCLERRDHEVILSVADDGPGIPKVEQEQIFERFYRPETEATRRNQGSGLGLPIARAMIELHGGRIWVESAVGRGATFHVALPLDRPGPKGLEGGSR